LGLAAQVGVGRMKTLGSEDGTRGVFVDGVYIAWEGVWADKMISMEYDTHVHIMYYVISFV